MAVRASRRMALLALLVSGCSLLQLDDFDRPRCQSEADCDATIRASGADPAKCRVFFCSDQTGQCERAAAAGAERCDGVDNNCDAEGFIDEDAWLEQPIDEVGSDPEAIGLTVAHAPPAQATTYAVAFKPAEAIGYQIVNGVQQQSKRLSYAWHGSEPGAMQNCPTLGEASDTCTFRELALAADEERVLAVAINHAGCSRGQVRIGVSTTDDPFRFWLSNPRKDATYDNISIALGVDVPETNSGLLCTGASREPGEPSGATRPAVASVEGSEREQALALWLAADSTKSANGELCLGSSKAVAVEALGVFTSNQWLDATAGGKPKVLGRTHMLSAPAVVGVSDGDIDQQHGAIKPGARFLVGFASAEAPQGPATGELRFLSVRFEPRAEEAVRFEYAGAVEDAQAHHLSFSRGVAGRIAAAWRSGCDGQQSVRFMEFTWTLDRTLSLPEPLTLSTGPIVAGPHLLHSPRGFRANSPTGGWFVSWVTRTTDGETQLKLARVAEHNSTLLEIRTLASGDVSSTFPHLHDSEMGYSAIVEGGVTETHSTKCADRD